MTYRMAGSAARKTRTEQNQRIRRRCEQAPLRRVAGASRGSVPTLAASIPTENEKGEAPFPRSSPVLLCRPALSSAPMICVRC